MKTLIYMFTVVILLSITENSFSQKIKGLGVKGGAIFNGLITTDNNQRIFTDSSSSFNLISFDVALYSDIYISSSFGLNAELHYTVKGERKSDYLNILTPVNSNQGEFYERKYVSNRFQYIALHLLPHYKVAGNKSDMLYFFAGPKIEYLIGNYNSDFEDNLKIDNSIFEFGGVLGAGGEIINLLVIEFRFEYNFSNVYEIQYGNEKVKRHHTTVSCLAGLQLDKILKLKL